MFSFYPGGEEGVKERKDVKEERQLFTPGREGSGTTTRRRMYVYVC